MAINAKISVFIVRVEVIIIFSYVICMTVPLVWFFSKTVAKKVLCDFRVIRSRDGRDEISP